MKKLYYELEKKRNYYARIKEKAEKSLKGAPKEGRLRVANRKGAPQYYLLTQSGDTSGTYIKRKNLSIAKKLAQRDYDRKVVAVAERYCTAIDRFMKICPKQEISALHLDNPGRNKLIQPYELSDEEFVKRWQEVSYQGKTFDMDASEIFTNRGERVRSKSEKMIADKLFEMGIPYRYEYPVQLKGYGTIYPDFTILNTNLRKEIILEHLGMMDNPEYCIKALEKIQTYEKNGIFPGEQLLLTFETAVMPLDTRILQKMFEKFIL